MSSPRSGPEHRYLISPRPGPGVCSRCYDLTEAAGGLCRNCRGQPDNINVAAAISYSIGGGWLHREIVAYKRSADRSVTDAARDLAGLLEGFTCVHERCLADAAGGGFDLVTTVPSGSARPRRDNHHPLRGLVWSVPSLRERHQRVLYPGLHRGLERRYDPLRYFAFADLGGARVLLIDDLWTTGSSAQSAAAALRAAGASAVAVVVIGRHLNSSWADNDRRLRRLRGNFSAERCALCAGGVVLRPRGQDQGARRAPAEKTSLPSP